MNMRRTLLILFAVALPLVVLAVILPHAKDKASVEYKADIKSDNGPIVLKCYVGENMVKPMMEIASVFERLHPGVKLEYHDSGTTSLDKMIRETQIGDLFLPGSNSYTDKMKEDGLVIWDANVCKHILAAIVLKDGRIKTWENVVAPGVVVGRGNENVCSVGKVAKKVVDQSSLPQFQQNVTIVSVINYQASSYELLTDGTIDVLLNWRNMCMCPDNIRGRMTVIDIPEEINVIKTIPIAVLRYSKHPREAKQFARFVASDEGKTIFQKYGFVTVND